MNPEPPNLHRSDGENSPLFIHCETFYHWLLNTTLKFPRRVRYTFTNRIDNLALEILEQLSDAWFTKNREDKQQILEKINCLNTRLRILLRQAYYQKILAPYRFEYAANQVEITGKMIGGWIKEVAGRKEQEQ